MSKFVGKVVTVDDLGDAPTRTEFLDRDEVRECRKALRESRSVLFMPTSVIDSFSPEKKGEITVDVYSKRVYKVMMFGILRSGEKITVILDDIRPFVELRVPDNTTAAEYEKRLKREMEEQKIRDCETSIVRGLGFREYHDKAQYVVMRFLAQTARKRALRYFDDKGYDTAHDDSTCYYRVVMRDARLPLTSWCTLGAGYRAVRDHPLTNTKWTVTIRYDAVTPYAGDIMGDTRLRNDRTVECGFDIETYDPEPKDDVPQPESETAEMFMLSLVFTFLDAEIVPHGCDPSTENYQWPMPAGHLIHYILTTSPCAEMPNRVVVLCRDMREMVMAMGMIWFKMQPDYVVSFNGDGYDWRWIAEVARRERLLPFLEKTLSLVKHDVYRAIEVDEKKRKFTNPRKPFTISVPETQSYTPGGYEFWNRYRFKISADLQNYPGAYLAYPGYINIDLMPQLRAMCGNPDKYSLHYFLNRFKLGDKVDMDYQEMFRMRARSRALLERLCAFATQTHDAGDVKAVAPAEHAAYVARTLKTFTMPALRELADRAGERDAFEHSAREILLVAEYCIVDSLRCHDLLVKTCYIRDKREVGVLAYTPMGDCVHRANGMKIRNLVISRAATRNVHLSNKTIKNPEEGKFPGAHVFPPTKGVAAPKPMPGEMRASELPEFNAWREMTDDEFDQAADVIARYGIRAEDYPADVLATLPRHVTAWLQTDHHYPIAGLDFSSLYPSIIMTYNLSPEMMVHRVERALELAEQGKRIHAIQFPFNGRIVKGWSVRHSFDPARGDKPDDPKCEFGIVPSILLELFNLRAQYKKDKKRLEHEKERFEKLESDEFVRQRDAYSLVVFQFNYINSKQNALKIFMNSIYGSLGEKTSPLRVLALAGGVTSGGIYNLKLAARTVEALGCRRYYGDSCTGQTPILLRFMADDGAYRVEIRRIDSVAGEWRVSDNSDKQINDSWNRYEVWSKSGWTRVERAIRHRVAKRLYRVYTPTGIVEVTEDHSLFRDSGEPVTPDRCHAGETRLLHRYPAFSSGAVSIESHCNESLEGENLNAYTTGALHGSMNRYNKEIGVPGRFLNASLDARVWFLRGWIFAHGDVASNEKPAYIYCHGATCAARLYYLVASVGYSPYVATCSENSYRITCSTTRDNSATTVARVEQLDAKDDTYVYDLTTANHTFQAGVGELIISNTDSVYISMPRDTFAEIDRRLYGVRARDFMLDLKRRYHQEVVDASFQRIPAVNAEVNDTLARDNGTRFLNMAFEEFLYVTIFFSKKKYAGIDHLSSFNPAPKDFFKRGLEFIKRGANVMLERLSKDILWRVFHPNNLVPLIDIVVEKVNEIYSKRDIEFEHFVKTATYRPARKNMAVHTFYRRMLAIGIAPAPLERFRYVVVKKYPFKYDARGRKQKLSVGDKMEYADRAVALGMEIDLDYYMGSNVCGQLARFISYHEMFRVTPRDSSPEAYDDAEKASYKLAQKFVLNLYKKWNTEYVSKGPALRTLYKKVSTVFREEFDRVTQVSNVLVDPSAAAEKRRKAKGEDPMGGETNLYETLVAKIEKRAETESRRETRKLVSQITATTLEQWIAKRDAYRSLQATREARFRTALPHALAALRAKIARLQALLAKRDSILEQGIAELIPKVGADSESFTTLEPILDRITQLDTNEIRREIAGKIRSSIQRSDFVVANEIDSACAEILALYKMRNTTANMVDELSSYVRCKLGDTSDVVRALRERDLKEMDDWIAENLV